MRLKIGQEVDFHPTLRYFRHSRDSTITSVYDALIELITNADDSYHRLYVGQKRNKDGGDILIEHLEQRGDKPSTICVRDKAEGMDDEEMYRKLSQPGAYTSGAGDRGYMGRGSKDCTALGDLVYESVKGSRYFKCEITNRGKFRVLERRDANQADRRALGISHGNGTCVTLVLNKAVPLPRYKTLFEDLPWHYALRDILSAESQSVVRLRSMVDKGEAKQLVYRAPDAVLVVDEGFGIPGYAGAPARLRIWRSKELLDEYKIQFERFGIIVKGERAIYESGLLSDQLKADPNARRYFGRLECPYMDQLLRQYDEAYEARKPAPPNNPRLLLDPSRRWGLDRSHPFIEALLKLPSERLKALIAKDKEQEKSGQVEVASQETKSRLDRLAKLAARFLRQQLDELDEVSVGEEVDDTFAKQGFFIYPTYQVRVAVAKERTLTVYAVASLFKGDPEPVIVETDSPDAIEVCGSPLRLHPHKSRQDRLLGVLTIRGRSVADSVTLTAKCQGLPDAEALVQVVEDKVEDHVFGSPLEFERKEYELRLGSRKYLHLYAKYPELVGAETMVKVHCADPAKAAVIGRCVLTPVPGTNYAEGPVTVEGRTLKAKTSVTAEVSGQAASALLKIVDKHEQEHGAPIRIEIVPEKFGASRAMWADNDGKPNVLKIAARHRSLARYLGEKEPYPGQHTPHFRVLLAEIVAESVCMKALRAEARQRPFDFPWADLKDPHVIADDVLAKLHQRMGDFVADAHVIMLADRDIPQLHSATAKLPGDKS